MGHEREKISAVRLLPLPRRQIPGTGCRSRVIAIPRIAGVPRLTVVLGRNLAASQPHQMTPLVGTRCRMRCSRCQIGVSFGVLELAKQLGNVSQACKMMG